MLVTYSGKCMGERTTFPGHCSMCKAALTKGAGLVGADSIVHMEVRGTASLTGVRAEA